MISKSTIKLIKSLALKKYRLKENLFLVESDKNVLEALNSSIKVEKLFVTESFFLNYEESCIKAKSKLVVSHAEIKKASLLNNPQNSIALCSMPDAEKLPVALGNNLSIFLDNIQDPGNLGTIIRLCDWFQIEYLFCSPDTVDQYNPKVIQATMGSFTRINVIKSDFNMVAPIAKQSGTKIFGAFLEGKSVYKQELPDKSLLVLGNEGNGITKDTESAIDHKIKIPSFSNQAVSPESLNVSVAAAIFCSEFKRDFSF